MQPLTIIQRKDVIPEIHGRYLSFPGLVKTMSGDLVLGYRDAKAQPNTFSHGIEGDFKIIRYENGQWSEPQLLYRHTENLEEMGCGDLSLISDGTIVLFSRQWDAANHRSAGVYIATSDDHDRTFLPRRPIAIPEFPNGWAPYGKILEMPDGRWLLGGYGTRVQEKGFSAACLSSEDRGLSWHLYSWIAICGCIDGEVFEQRGFPEPLMLALDDGEIYVLLRTNGTFYATRSLDHGKIWSRPEPAFEGMAAAGTRLSTRELLVTYRGIHESLSPGERPAVVARRKGRLYCGRLSRDGGRTWSDELAIDDGEAWQVGSYGMGDVVEMDDGKILVVYYTSNKNQAPWLQQCTLSR